MSPVQHTPRHLVPPTIKRLACAALGALAFMWAVSARAYPVLVLPNPGGILKAVVPDASGTSAAQQVQGVTIAAGSTAQVNFAVVKQDGTAADLTGAQVLLTVKHSVTDANPLISRQATITTPATLGVGYFPLVITDTLTMRGVYQYDVFVTWPDGSRTQVVPSSTWNVTQAQGQPNQAVTVPATQQPLAQGPPGLGQMQSPPGSALTQRQIITVDGTELRATDNATTHATDLTIASLAGSKVSGAVASATTTAQLQGTPVSSTAPNQGQGMLYDGTRWSPVAGTYNCKAFGATGSGVTDDTAALQACINAALAASHSEIYVPAGNYVISSSLTFSQASGFTFRGAGEEATTFTWAGGTGGTAISISGVSYARFERFMVIGSGDTTGMLINGSLSPAAISTENKFEHLLFNSGFTYCVRIGTIAFQADQSSFEDCRFTGASIAGVSIEDANAVVWNFSHCHWTNCNFGITAIHGTGGSFNLYSCGFNTNGGVVTTPTSLTAPMGTNDTTATVASTSGFPPYGAIAIDSEVMTYTGTTSTTFTGITRGIYTTTAATHNSAASVGFSGFDIEVFPSSRGTAIVGSWSEGSGRFLHTRPSSAAAQVDLVGVSVNGMQGPSGFADANWNGVGMVLEATGGVNLHGGYYRGSYGAYTAPFQIIVQFNNNHRTNINVDGAVFYNGNPFNSTALRNGSIHLSNVQNAGAMSDTSPGATSGFMAMGSPTTPKTGTPNLQWAPAMYWSIAAGTTLVPGDNTYTFSSKNCQGSSRVEATVISWGGIPAGTASITGSDSGSGTCALTVNVPWNYTLTGTNGLELYVFINPDPWSVQ